MTRHILFCYKPDKHWVTVDASYEKVTIGGDSTRLGTLSLISLKDPTSDAVARLTQEMAKEELVPLMTLARLHPTFVLGDTCWDDERVTVDCRVRSGTDLHSGPFSILTAVYTANGEDLPQSLSPL